MALNGAKTELYNSKKIPVNWIAVRNIKKCIDFSQVRQSVYTQ